MKNGVTLEIQRSWLWMLLWLIAVFFWVVPPGVFWATLSLASTLVLNCILFVSLCSVYLAQVCFALCVFSIVITATKDNFLKFIPCQIWCVCHSIHVLLQEWKRTDFDYHWVQRWPLQPALCAQSEAFDEIHPTRAKSNLKQVTEKF